jgi:serine/threonine protein kinase
MPLSAGTRVGPYEIAAAIGSGGMGEVYRARDTRLGRDVAVKALPDDALVDAERIARFQREAQILAALNHPHIAAIYGLEDATLDGRSAPSHFLILELVGGGTLADRLARGPVPMRAAMGLARQLADALHAAHEKGIIHRDLKPANVALTADGQVKVLDFGIAKIKASRDDDLTVSREGTAVGAVIGTVAYMSPEQARGLPIDKRMDVWSFGCVVYEALTGTAPFRAATASDTIARVLGHDPDLSKLPADTPARIVWLVRRCLDKDPARRLHDLADARIELDEAIAEIENPAGRPAGAAPAASPFHVRERIAWIAAGLGLASALLVWIYAPRSGAANHAGAGLAVRSSVLLPHDVRLWQAEDPNVAARRRSRSCGRGAVARRHAGCREHARSAGGLT